MGLPEMATCLPIIIICYLVGMGIKACDKINDVCIPVMVGIVGGILGVIGMYVISDFPANDVLTAIAVGIMSGLTATGSNQVYKQIKKFQNGEE